MRPSPRLRAGTALRHDPARGTAPARRILFNPFVVGLLGALGVGVGIAIIGAVRTLATVLIYMGVAYFISLALEPIIRWATERNIPRWAASLAIVVLGLLVGFLIALAVVPVIVREVTHLISAAPGWAASLPDQAWVQWLTANVGSYIDVSYLTSQVTTFLSDPNQWLSIGGGLLAIGTGFGEAVTAVIVVTVLTLYFTLTLPLVMEKVYQAVPRSRRDGFRSVTDEILQSVGKYVAGQLLLALVNAIVTFILVTAVGGPVPIVLALVAFVCALIPVVGPILGTTIAVVATVFVNPVGALILAVLLLIYMQIEAYVLSPRVMAKAVSVPGALVIVAAIGGASLGGILGALVAIPVVAAGILIFERVIRPRQEAK
ncbi:AI-2E family transporter [Antiquaquibacter oligotrophicus]|nr:AI-2E family transporter [Antiquaquibacter oligotrophicus]UDF12970.1 AI-2E family transporter [Antiquaquibacter oligotrophicus]